jgi:hypothetical protein
MNLLNSKSPAYDMHEISMEKVQRYVAVDVDWLIAFMNTCFVVEI